MSPRLCIALCLPALMLGAALPATANTAGDPAKGKSAYAQRCASCHSIDYNGTGPMHRGVLGRKAGSVANFAYSAALKSSDVTWSAETLDKWLSDPEKFIPGQRMWISIPDPVERQDIIAYLQGQTSK